MDKTRRETRCPYPYCGEAADSDFLSSSLEQQVSIRRGLERDKKDLRNENKRYRQALKEIANGESHPQFTARQALNHEE